MTPRQMFWGDPPQRIRGRALKQYAVIARVAIQIDKLPRLVAGQEAVLPVLDARGEHGAV
jgi:hypothetical protein